MSWNPSRTLAETEALLTAPGSIHELETALVDGRLYRVYKNLWPSLRDFWLSAVSQYADDTYIVYEDQRLTYGQVHHRSVKIAGLLRTVYSIKQGDRVAICSRNTPEYLAIFWACHLVGAVSVLANAWLPLKPLSHCLAVTGSKIIFVDSERADLLEPVVPQLFRDTEVKTFLVLDVSDYRKRWKGMQPYQNCLDKYQGNGQEVITQPPSVYPEDNATIIFTSGTTGLPKGVLSTQRQFLTNVLNLLAGGLRATLRKGDDYPTAPKSGPQKGALVAVPLFHVTGCTSFSMMATMTGMKIVMAKKWEVEEENVAVAGGVPSMVTDLTLSSLVGHPLEGLLFGGAPAPDSLVPRARKAFPTATMIQAYGLTETNSIAVSFAGDDYTARPTSTGLASPVNDIRIVHEGICVPDRTVGEVWLRGPNVMKCYWGDPKATDEMITKDGWLRTGDIGYVDEEGFLYIKDRLKDIIIRGGENIDSVTVENALYADPRILEAAAVGVPDDRLGELVTAIVSVRPTYEGQVTEDGLLEQVKSSLPKFAVPVMILILNRTFERTPSGKIIKADLRKLARKQWELRSTEGSGKTSRQPLANL
ncbi:hypothetical protein HYPSUDRAFT_68905 [Hypholoma sublateritium FD-334 SS-4]|uniref:AMP-dependent synthetase/ligase domain-containing protein n=1 Tax=Hypholoma sublateritium (strain FD-334 SS-4) TaxID=945553 RepID=A0A0D2M992_HYPSF|nr:hypothetical protein HYPSUDRAFT_68905 [Hypholoma sublateritium FD-334 SS-4]